MPYTAEDIERMRKGMQFSSTQTSGKYTADDIELLRKGQKLPTPQAQVAQNVPMPQVQESPKIPVPTSANVNQNNVNPLGAGFMKGVVESNKGLLSIPKLAYKGVSTLTDLVTPDSWYKPENDLLLKALDKGVKYYDTASQEYDKQMQGAGIGENAAYNVASMVPQAITAAVTSKIPLPKFGTVGGLVSNVTQPVTQAVTNILPKTLNPVARNLLPVMAKEGVENTLVGAGIDLAAERSPSEMARNALGNFGFGAGFAGLLNLPGAIKSAKALPIPEISTSKKDIPDLIPKTTPDASQRIPMPDTPGTKIDAPEIKNSVMAENTGMPGSIPSKNAFSFEKSFPMGTEVQYTDPLSFKNKKITGKVIGYKTNPITGDLFAEIDTGLPTANGKGNYIGYAGLVNDIEVLNNPLSKVSNNTPIITEGINMPRKTSSSMDMPNVKVLEIDSDAPIHDKANKERGFSKNVRTDLNMEDEIRKNFDSDPLFYEQLANETTLDKAQVIFNRGYDFARSYWMDTSRKFDPSDVPLSRMIANEAIRQGDTAFARDVITTTAERLTQAGQFSQAAKILRDSDPGTFDIFLQKQINKLNIEGAKQYGKKWNNIQLTDGELNLISGMANLDDAGKEKMMESIYDRINKQIPSTITEKVDAWRRMAMLLNPRTHLKNVTGNIIMMAMRKASDTGAAALEKLAGLKPGERTKSFLWSRNKNIVDMVNADWNASKADLLGEGRYDIGSLNFMNKNKPIFNKGFATKIAEKVLGKEFDKGILEAVNQFSKDALNAGDVPFLERAYKDSLGQYMQANKLTQVTNQAKEYATRRAYEATFKQVNILNDFINKAKKLKGIGLLVEAVFPFSKTPTNITMRAIEYSPVGLIKALYSKAAGKTTADVIEDLAKGMTGTAVAALGFLLASLGWARSGRSNSKNAEAILSQAGEQPYSIITPHGSYTFDWAQPTASTFALGVTFFEELDKYDEINIESITNAIAAGGDTIFNMSMLQNIKELLGGGYGSPTEKIMGLPVTYIEQTFPAILGQTARTVDDTRRSTYDPDPLKAFTNELKAKTPGLSKTLEPRLDIFGNEQRQGGAFQQFVNPGYYKEKSTDIVTNELARIYKSTKETSLLPKLAPYKFTSGGKEIKLTAQEVTQFQRTMGQKNYTEINRLINSGQYKYMNDSDKAKVLRKIVDSNYDYAKQEVLQQKNILPKLSIQR
ncbi:hypothetical protein OXPF_34590 [Oxobacter pfennigii]|uniref:Large polyvalent protein associated domain-containing protein n=1 Tax=Oxobacter pfennigii TaxID=36849 RepID=A0A0P8YTK0_9CLOT|nr:hypothetical protein [Oxobacter pfennigii]KPU43027.1 hypothetical protein OXPF_34590 [Oxobacter pfennigii]